MPKGYVVVDLDVLDEAAYRPYRDQAGPNVVANGGRYLVRGGPTQVREGSWDPKRLVILEFPSLQAANAWYDSPAYQRILPIRRSTTRGSLLMAEGAAGPGPFDRLPAPLRVAADADLPGALALLRQMGCLREAADAADRLRAFQGHGTSAVIVLGPPGAPEAAATVHLLPQPAVAGLQVFVEDLVVDAAARGRGHGKAMMEGIKAWGKAIGATWLRARGDEASGPSFEARGLERGDLNFEGPLGPL